MNCPKCNEKAKKYSCTSMEGLHFCPSVKCSAIFTDWQQSQIAELQRQLESIAFFVETHWKGSGLKLEADWIIKQIADNYDYYQKKNDCLEDQLSIALEALGKYADEGNWEQEMLEDSGMIARVSTYGPESAQEAIANIEKIGRSVK